MIFDNIHNQISPRIKSLPRIIQEAIDYLLQTDFSELENKAYPIKGDKVFVVIQEYQTKPKMEKTAEQHRKYIDIQYIISGTEIIGVGRENPKNEVIDGYNKEKERIKYGKTYDEKDIVVSQGDYLILFPEDIHRPGCDFRGQANIRKAVIKIAVDLL